MRIMSPGNPAFAQIPFQQIIDELMEAQAHDASLLQFKHRVTAHQYLRLYGVVARYVKPGSRILDWGTGNGHFSYFLQRAGYRASGYDFSVLPALCRRLAADYEFKTADLSDPCRLPFASESFEAVTSVGVLEHVRDSGGAEIDSLRELYRLLKPGGIFICYHLPNRYSWIEGALHLVGRWSHRCRYTRREINELAQAAGFALLEVERYALLPRNIWWWDPLRKINGSPRLARAYDALDDALAKIAAPVCQNYLFVAQKPVA